MRRMINCLAVASSIYLLAADSSQGQQKVQPKPKPKAETVVKEVATPQDYAALAQVQDVIGKIADFDLKAGTLTFTLEWSRWEPNPKYNPAKATGKGKADKTNQAALLYQQLMRDYDTIMRTKNPVQRQQALMSYRIRLQQLQATATAGLNPQAMFTITKAAKDFMLDVVDDLKVARVELLRKYDDEGELIKYTAEELKKLRSPDVPGGYIAKTDELIIGQSVKLFLSPPKKAGSKLAKGDEPVQASVAVARPRVRMILILEEAPPPPEPKDLPKKKKKD